MNNRPLIAVTGPDRGGAAAWWFTRLAIWRAGGRARRLNPAGSGGPSAIQGIVIGGGADVDPNLYGQEELARIKALVIQQHRRSHSLLRILLYPAIYLLRRLLSLNRIAGVDRARDAFEFSLLERAISRGLPVFGICRGAQLLNVVTGGTLYQDLRDFYMESPQVSTVLPLKVALVEPGSHLARIMDRPRIRINALHHQAVDKLGRHIRIAAQEPNRVVQAIEHTRHPFAIGVQWHPEYLPHKPDHQRLFRALIDAARTDHKKALLV